MKKFFKIGISIYRRCGKVQGLQFIDTHCHIMPGVDDGAPDMETSVGMAEIAAADGIVTMVATPHIVEGLYNGVDRSDRLKDLAAVLSDRGIQLDLVPGAEVPLSGCLTLEADELAELTMGRSRYLLIETLDAEIEHLRRAVHRINAYGLYAILAHPERAGFTIRKMEVLREMVVSGRVICQLTAAAVEGLYGKRVQGTSFNMAKAGIAQLVATDAHSDSSRVPRLSESFKILGQIIGKEDAEKIMLANAESLLEDLEIKSEVREFSRRQRIFSSFFRKGRERRLS